MTEDNKNTDDFEGIPDPIKLGQALLHAYEKAQPVFQKMMHDYASPETQKNIEFDPLNIRECYMDYINQVAQNPEKMWGIQTEFMNEWVGLWSQSMQNFIGEHSPAPNLSDNNDKRFKAPEWQSSAVFNFVKQSYFLACKQIEESIDGADNLDEQQRRKLSFQAKLFTDAMSPTNFVMTNPDVMNETIKTGGQNLVKGFENLIQDIEEGQGVLRVKTTDNNTFELGKNIAVTEGSVVYENDLMQLIQYAPQTNTVLKTPLLIVPPCINKYYILDLRPGNSVVEWLVGQGHTVFMISWINPDASLAHKKFEDYMMQGIMESLTHIEKTTGEESVNTIGYCLGGTLLAATLSYMHTHGIEQKVKSATFLTTLLDFEQAGDMTLFLDNDNIAHIEKMMENAGVFSGREMQKTFSLMRANDLIWSFVVNNYLMGREPFPFDLLYWNDDCTNLPAEMHKFYLRNMYRDNKLIKAGQVVLNDTPIDLTEIKTPCHFVSTQEDHIAPWLATYDGAKTLSADVKFTLAGSGHIAGVVNLPTKNKYGYKTYDDSLPESAQNWEAGATQHEGSWWVYWQQTMKQYTGKDVQPRTIEKSIEPAPGRYVRVRA